MPVCSDPGQPIGLALGAALLFALGIQFSHLGLRHLNSSLGTLITIATAAALYWLATPWYLQSAYWFTGAAVLFAVLGIFRPALSANLAMAGTARLGPTISSTLSATSPFFGLLLGVLILGESVSLVLIGGTAAIVLGVITLSSGRGLGGPDQWPLWALGLPIAAAVIRVLAHVFTKIGMTEVPSPMFAGLMAYTVSTVIALWVARRDATAIGPALRSEGARWFVLVGVCYAGAIFCLNTALACGDVVVIAPITAAQPVFAMILGLTIFKERRFSFRLLVAVGLVVLGVVTIAVHR
ncbi:MAG: EamA family transporter [Pseudomonadota bacterium]